MYQDNLGTFSAHKGHMNLEYMSAGSVQNLHLPFLSVLKHIIQFKARMIGNPNIYSIHLLFHLDPPDIDDRGYQTVIPKLPCWPRILWSVWH